MSGYFEGLLWAKALILVLLAVGFVGLFGRLRLLGMCIGWLHRTRECMDESARKHLLENRQMIQSLQKEHSLWFRLERQLTYSGLKRRFSKLTVESWIAGNVVTASGLLSAGLLSGRLRIAIGLMALLLLLQAGVVAWGRQRAMQSVNDNLMKFLDFLGNYSITAGEITGIFNQVGKYLEEPLKGVLEECYLEAQTTGDTAMALLAMTEKIEHPKFRELVRNMEISMRYSADFTALVQSSRRSIREYLRSGSERKGLLREAVINMLLLVGLSGFIFLTVDGLIEVSMWQILFFTIPGRLGLGVLAVIFSLFGRRIYRVYH